MIANTNHKEPSKLTWSVAEIIDPLKRTNLNEKLKSKEVFYHLTYDKTETIQHIMTKDDIREIINAAKILNNYHLAAEIDEVMTVWIKDLQKFLELHALSEKVKSTNALGLTSRTSLAAFKTKIASPGCDV